MSQFMVANTLDSGAGSLRNQTSQHDADAAGGQYGRTITWTYQVTNTSSADAPVADTTDQDFALVIYNGTAGMASAIADADALIDERYAFDFDGIGGGGSDLLIGGDSAPGQRVSFLISDWRSASAKTA